MRSDTAPEEEANLRREVRAEGPGCSPIASSPCGQAPFVTDPLPVPSLNMLSLFLTFPVLYQNSGWNQSSRFRASAGLLWGFGRHFCGAQWLRHLLRKPRHGPISITLSTVQRGVKMPWTWLGVSDFLPSLQGLKQHWHVNPAKSY